ncbi:MAG TPA: hypothetical protein VGF30_04250 [Bacteroidia bacterium]
MEQTANAGAPQRPGFLKVLCILTFIGSGIAIVMSVLAYLAVAALHKIGAGLSNAAMEMNPEGVTAEGQQAMEQMGNAMTNAYINLGAGILGAILCLVGAIMMWKLKKTGFYVYVFGQVVAMAVPFIFPIAEGAGGMGVIGMILPIAFIVMYGLNLKHLK